eukprot:Colp12_sorted_trinity150504_noHs@3281
MSQKKRPNLGANIPATQVESDKSYADLPLEIVAHIISFVDNVADLRSLSSVCKHFMHAVASSGRFVFKSTAGLHEGFIEDHAMELIEAFRRQQLSDLKELVCQPLSGVRLTALNLANIGLLTYSLETILDEVFSHTQSLQRLCVPVGCGRSRDGLGSTEIVSLLEKSNVPVNDLMLLGQSFDY